MCVRNGQFGNEFPWFDSVLQNPNSVFRCMFQLQPGERSRLVTGVPAEAREYSENRPDPLWGQPSILFSGYVGCFPRLLHLGHEVDHVLASRLRMSGAIPLLPLYAFMALTGTTSPSIFFRSTAAPHQRYYNSVCRLEFQFSVPILNTLPRCALIHASSMRTDGRTDRTKRIATFRSFTNAPKNPVSLSRYVLVCFVWISELTAIVSLTASTGWFL